MVLRCPFWDLGNVQEIDLITRTYLSQNNSCALAVERAIKEDTVSLILLLHIRIIKKLEKPFRSVFVKEL